MLGSTLLVNLTVPCSVIRGPMKGQTESTEECHFMDLGVVVLHARDLSNTMCKSILVSVNASISLFV